MREKREKLLEIKAKLAEPGGKFGVGIINNGKSYNKFSTKSADELAKIQKDENRYRKQLGYKNKKGKLVWSKDKRKINMGYEKGFVPALDPRALRAALKQRDAYYGGGKLNMVEVKGTNKLKEAALEEVEKKFANLEYEELELK